MAKVRMIDANALKEKFIKVANSMAKNSFQTYAAAMEEAAKMAERQPTIDAELVQHGRWIPNWASADEDGNMYYTCSNCGHGDHSALKTVVPYCWYCGAKMDKEGDR